MTFTTLAGWLDWTRRLIHEPRAAFQDVLRLRPTPAVSFMLIALSAAISGVMVGLSGILTGVETVVLELPTGERVEVQRSGPIPQAVVAFLVPVGLVWAVRLVGRRMNGQGRGAEILAVMAVLQFAMVPILIAQGLTSVVFPLGSLMILLFNLYIYLRGLGHAVTVAHRFDHVGQSVVVIVLSFLTLAFAFLIVMMFFGPLFLPRGAGV